jgi:hypothetical protein
MRKALLTVLIMTAIHFVFACGGDSGGFDTGGGTGGATSTGPMATGGLPEDWNACAIAAPGTFNCGGTTGAATGGGGGGGAGGTTLTGTVGAGGMGTGGLPVDSNACAIAGPGTFNCGGTTGAATGGSGGGTSDTSGCTCVGNTTTWDCFCRVNDCAKNLSAYSATGGLSANYGARMEYAGCNLVEIDTINSVDIRREVYDMTTGKMVGEELGHTAGTACPFGAADAGPGTLKAGTFPDASCARTKCVEGNAIDACMPGPDGGARRD